METSVLLTRFIWNWRKKEISSENILKIINEIQLDDLYAILKMIKNNLEKALVIYGPKVKSVNKKNIEKVFYNEK